VTVTKAAPAPIAEAPSKGPTVAKVTPAPIAEAPSKAATATKNTGIWITTAIAIRDSRIAEGFARERRAGPVACARKAAQRLQLLALACLLLGGCRTGIDSTKLDADEYAIRGSSPGGMVGAFLSVPPSVNAVQSEAQRLCPGGYEKTYQETGDFADRLYIEWHIRCHAPAQR
jgi:hypothetical protein